MIPAKSAYLYADVLVETGVSESYLAFLIRQGLVRPVKARNGRTNLFAPAELERIRWALRHRGQMSVPQMQEALAAEAAGERTAAPIQACV